MSDVPEDVREWIMHASRAAAIYERYGVKPVNETKAKKVLAWIGSQPVAPQPDSDLRQLLVDISIICGPSTYELHRSLAKRAERYLWSTASTSQPGADLRGLCAKCSGKEVSWIAEGGIEHE